MSFGEDEEILQDFLIEAGEILEQLSEQLVDLEQRPDDRDLLNAIFRGFHTVKGGAGFLQLNPLVDCCHITENLFDILRTGQRDVTPELMDVVLQALDAINEMFGDIKAGAHPTAAPPDLLARLESLVSDAQPGGDTESAPTQVTAEIAQPGSPSDEWIETEEDLSDAEFERFLDAIAEPGADPVPESGAESEASGHDEITDDEFEALLDQLHGKGRHGGMPAAESGASGGSGGTGDDTDSISDEEFEALLDQLHGGAAPGSSAAAQSAASPDLQPRASSSAADSDALIDEDEFEALLDQLHGRGKGPTSSAEAAAGVPAAGDPVAGIPVAGNPVAGNPVAGTPEAAKPNAAEPGAPAAAKRSAARAEEAGGRPTARDAAPTGETSVRVDTQRLDDIMNMVGELVLVRNRLVRLGGASGDQEISKAVSNLDVVTADLQSAVMKTRMQPIRKVFGRFPRVVRDMARNLRKEITLELQGEDTDLDKNLVEALADPLVHLVRNAVDHGIEMPEVRERAGKPRTGRIVLAAQQEGDHILLSITDDGAGMDADVLRRKVVEKGLMDADSAARLSESDCYNLIFLPGFSTKVEISDVSGRGVGMDVVKTKISQLNGSVEIQSRPGEGTRLAIKVPLTLAIMPTLMVMLGEQTFALPLVSVNEIFHMDLRKTHVVDGREVITVRDTAIPLFHLKRWLVRGQRNARQEFAHVVIVSVGTQRMGFVVDQLIGQEEVVIKPLGGMLHGTPGMAGATITGDGRIALILDVPSLLKHYAGR